MCFFHELNIVIYILRHEFIQKFSKQIFNISYAVQFNVIEL